MNSFLQELTSPAASVFSGHRMKIPSLPLFSCTRAAALALALLASPSLYSQTNLISNGDFSAPTTNGSTPTGWTKDFNSYGIYSGSASMTPHSGSYLLHAGSNSSTGGEYQDIATTANRTYLATLWLQGWANIIGGDSLNRQQGALVVGGASGNSSVTLGSSLLQTTAATTVAISNATVTNFMAIGAGATGSSPWYQQASSFTATGSTTRVGVYNVSTASFKSGANVDDVGVYAANDWNLNSDGNWSTGANWADGFAPNATGAVAAFAGVATAPRTITLDSNATVGALIFNNANAYTISGANSLTLSGNFVSGNASGAFMGPVVTVNTGNHTINTNIAISGALAPLFAINQGARLTAGGVISGSTGVVKSGFGTLTLGGNNTYSGTTSINSGTLEISSSGLLGGGNYSQNIANSGTFLLGSNSNQILSGVISGIGALTKNNTGTLTLSGNNTYSGASTLNAGTVEIASTGRLGGGTYTGAITNNAALIYSGTNNQILSGVISGAGNLTHNATSTLTLSNAGNTFNGITTVNAGTLTLGANQNIGAIAGAGALNLASYTLTTNSSSNTTFSGVISGTGGLTKNGTGTLTLSNAANTYNGTTTINAGTLAVSGNISSSALTLNSGGVVSAGTAASVAKYNASSLTINGGSGYAFTIGNISGGTVGTAGTDYDQLTTTGAITFNNTIANPFTVYINGTPTNWSSSGNYTWNILSGASLSGFFSGNFIADTSAFGGSLAAGAGFTFGTSGGNLTLTYGTAGTPTWAGGTGVWSGNFTPSLSNNLPMLFTGAGGTATNDIGNGTLTAVGAITFNSTAGAYTLAANVGSAGASGGTALAVNGDITNNSASLQTINTAMSFGATRTVNTAAGNITVGGAISGAGGLAKNGTGILTLNATNTFTGGVVINAGTLATGSAGLLADTVNVTINSGATYRVGAADTIRSASGAGDIILNANLSFNPNVSNSAWSSPTIQLSGNISGTGQLIGAANGYSNMTLSGNNSGWSGGISLGSYTIVNVGSANATGTGTIDFQNGSSETYIMSSDTTDRIINNQMTKNSGSVMAPIFGSAATGNLTFGGNFTWSFGRDYSLKVDNTWTQFNGAINVTNNNDGTYTWTKLGNGTLILNGNNSLALNTTISAGTLQIGAAGRLAGGNYSSNMTNNGAFVYSGTNNQILGGIISGNGALTKNNTGTLTLTNTNTYTGATAINGGTLSIASITNGGVAGNLGNSTNAAGNLVLGGGSLLYTGANGSTDRNFTLTNSTTSEINISNATTTLTISGTSASTSGALTKNGSGTLVLSGNNGHSGATTINAGTLVLSGTNTGSAITINSGASLLGSGSLGTTTVNSGGKIAPGAAAATVGSLTVAGLTLNSGGTYTWDMSNATGAAGTGWDRIVNSGLLTIGATSGSQFTIAITSNGAPSNWDFASTGQYWDIITYGSQSGFAADKFALNTSAFGGSLTLDSSWALSDTGSALRLTYTYAASTPSWSGGSGNWSGGFTPPITNGANATFAGPGGTATNDITSATLSSVGAILFSVTGSYTLQANSGSAGFDTASALAVGGSITNTSTGSQTINLALSFASNQTISASSGNIAIGGPISGAGALTKQGNNTLTLLGANTYSGGTALTAGQLNINNATALGNGTITITSGTLDNTSGSSITLTNNNAQNWNGDFSFAGTNNLNLGTGAVAMNANRTVAVNGSTLTVGGVVSGSGFGLTKNGSGTLTLAGNNTYSGTTTINGGALEIGGAGRLGGGSYSGTIAINGASTNFLYNSSNNQTLSGAISGNGGLTKNGSGTLTLSAANNYSGGTIVNNGTIILGVSNAIQGSSVIINSGASIVNGGAHGPMGSAVNLTINGGTFDLGARTLQLTSVNMTDGSLLGDGSSNNYYVTNGFILAGNNTITGGIDMRIGTPSSGFFNVTSGTTTISGTIANVHGSSQGLTKNGTGTLTLSGNNGFRGTTLNAGTLNINSATALGNGSFSFNINGGTIDNTSGSAKALTNNNSQNWNGDFAFTGTNDLNLGTGAVTMNASRTVTVNGGNLTVGGAIGGTTFALTKNGTGNLILYGASTYNGTTTVNAGTISIGAADRIADTSNLNVVGGTFNLAGFNETLGSITGSGNITLGAGTLTTNSSSSTTFSGLISGTGGFTKVGLGSLTLSANNTYTGITTISAGTLEISSTGLLGGGNYSANIVNNGTLLIASNSNQTLSGNISGTGSLAKNGSGSLTLAGNSNYSGNTTINTGTLVIGNANAAGTGTISQTNGASLLKFDTTGTITNAMSVYNVLASQSATLSGAITVNNATWDIETGDTLTISGAVSGNGGVTKTGGGTLVLSGNNTYLAPTVINAGTLEAASVNALGANNTVQVNGGTLLVSTDNAIIGMNITLNGTSTTLAGLAFSGNYSGLVDNLTLSKNSIIDLGEGSVSIMFDTIVMSTYMLDIYNWTGTTLWGGGTGNDTDRVYYGPDLSDVTLANIRFHSGAVGGGDSFLGSGFDLGLKATSFDPGLSGNQIIPVPEPETWATGLLLLLGGAVWLWRKRRIRI